MKTIFEHGITHEERENVIPGRAEQTKGLYLGGITQRLAYGPIARLCYHRGDNSKGELYAAKRDAEIWFHDTFE